MITNEKFQDWSTPDEVFAGLHADYAFTIDACASALNAKLPLYVDEEMDIFKHDFRGHRVFCNPPFGDIATFMALARWWTRHGCPFWGCLVPANIETQWYLRDAVHGDKHTFRGRINFKPPIDPATGQPIVVMGPDGKPRKLNSPTFGCIFVMFGEGVQSSGLGFSALRDAKTGKVVQL